MDLTRWMPEDDREAEDVEEATEEVMLDDPEVMPKNSELPGARRIQSPSSILTHKQCPRKYYYRYIERLPGPESIHLIRGKVVHKVLEDIYDADFSQVPSESFFSSLKYVLQESFRKEWYAAAGDLGMLDLSPEALDEYFEESRLMIDNFYHYVYDRMRPLLKTHSAQEAWDRLMPERELKLESPRNLVRGFVDALERDEEGNIAIIDYKTSKKFDLTPEYKLQLGIYAMMQEERGEPADEVGILFLKHGRELRVPADKGLVEDAREACSQVQLETQSNDMSDYPKRPGPLCKWRTGQCEYYELCFAGETVPEYRERMSLRR